MYTIRKLRYDCCSYEFACFSSAKHCAAAVQGKLYAFAELVQIIQNKLYVHSAHSPTHAPHSSYTQAKENERIIWCAGLFESIIRAKLCAADAYLLLSFRYMRWRRFAFNFSSTSNKNYYFIFAFCACPFRPPPPFPLSLRFSLAFSFFFHFVHDCFEYWFWWLLDILSLP